MAEIDLSVVIISSKKNYLFGCLTTLRPALEGLRNEIILVDNASPDRIGDQAKDRFSEIKVLRREKNGGFGENNNMGMRIAKGKYILLLNDDTELIDRNIFREMVKWMDEHSKVGVSSCGLLNKDKKTFQGSGGYFPNLLRVAAWMTFIDDIPGLDLLIKPYHPLHGWSPFYKGEGYFRRPHKQDWVTGAFYLMRKEAMDEAGLFDEDLFLYVEEVELSYRFALKGWEIWYLPEWKIVHYGQVTTGNERAIIFELQNLRIFYKKHMPPWQFPILTFILKLGVVLRIILYSLINPNVSKIYQKAYVSL